jgi:Na+-transporting NADH:ubiquinone oxidoreductase subunit A
MSAEITIKQGMDIPMEGAPGSQIREVRPKGTISVYPSEYKKLKFKALVEEGDKVVRGGILARRKDLTDFKVRAPVSGTVKAINLGDRRSLKEIVIEPDGSDATETFPSFAADALLTTEASAILEVLTTSGLLACIRERPFDKIANPEHAPKSIFVNGMATAPFRPDAGILVQGREAEFQAGLNALNALTDGPVHLNLAAVLKGSESALTKAQHVQVNYFSGPHPSGNTSTHIHYLDPIIPGDVVWTLRVSDVIRIGSLLTTGVYPNTQRVLVTGEGVKEEFRGYVDVTTGTPLAEVLSGALEDGDQRVVRGDLLAGEAANVEDTGIYLYDQGFVVLPEDRERHLLGWYAPTKEQFSAHKVVPSAWLKGKKFSFGTNTRGSKRAMVLTGIYDPYVALDIMVDPLSRACIAGETEDAIAMGILESVPEDFALCTFICPSKTDFGTIIADALAAIEQEGI